MFINLLETEDRVLTNKEKKILYLLFSEITFDGRKIELFTPDEEYTVFLNEKKIPVSISHSVLRHNKKIHGECLEIIASFDDSILFESGTVIANIIKTIDLNPKESTITLTDHQRIVKVIPNCNIDYIKNEVTNGKQAADYLGMKDAVIVNGAAYIVMHYLDGEDLFDMLHDLGNSSKNTDARIKLARSLLVHTKEIHEKGIIHGDLKPENVRVVQQSLKILDFGLSKDLNDHVSPLKDQKILGGTLIFMPLESLKDICSMVFNADEKKGLFPPDLLPPGPQSDVYLVGRTLAEIFKMHYILCQLYDVNGHQNKDFIRAVITYASQDAVYNTQDFFKLKGLNLLHAEEIEKIILGLTKCRPENRLSIDDAIKMIDIVIFERKFIPKLVTSQNQLNSWQIFITACYNHTTDFLNLYQKALQAKKDFTLIGKLLHDSLDSIKCQKAYLPIFFEIFIKTTNIKAFNNLSTIEELKNKFKNIAEELTQQLALFSSGKSTITLRKTLIEKYLTLATNDEIKWHLQILLDDINNCLKKFEHAKKIYEKSPGIDETLIYIEHLKKYHAHFAELLLTDKNSLPSVLLNLLTPPNINNLPSEEKEREQFITLKGTLYVMIFRYIDKKFNTTKKLNEKRITMLNKIISLLHTTHPEQFHDRMIEDLKNALPKASFPLFQPKSTLIDSLINEIKTFYKMSESDNIRCESPKLMRSANDS